MKDHSVDDTINLEHEQEQEQEQEQDSLHRILVPDISRSQDTISTLCVIGLARTHVAFKDTSGITAVDFNVGKSDRSGIKVTGKRKKNAQHFESNSALCKVNTDDASYIVRCCVKGSLLEVNDRLIKQPGLLNSSADREGYIAIIMPKPADWLKVKGSLLGLEESGLESKKELREVLLPMAVHLCSPSPVHLMALPG
ncbi:protein simiate [Quercus suber]|uniref:Protein simiate n=1 Tax=Quercus suber TaxID=58331 RepID=A0AAW0LXM8_QUESU